MIEATVTRYAVLKLNETLASDIYLTGCVRVGKTYPKTMLFCLPAMFPSPPPPRVIDVWPTEQAVTLCHAEVGYE